MHALLGLGFALAAVSSAAADEPKRGGQLVVALNADIRGTNAGVNRDANTDMVMHHVVEGLVAHREDLSVGPLLAEGWEVSADGRVYTFTLRDGLTFHNGEPVTAAEVKWSWDRLLKEETGWACARFYDGSRGMELESVEVVDDRTIRFTLAEPNHLFLTHMANIQCSPAVLHPDSVNPDGSWREAIGTGPYKIEEWRPGEYVLLARFEDYVPRDEPRDGYAGGRAAYLDEIKFLITPEESVAKAALLAGDIDVMPALGLEHVEEVRERGFDVQVIQGLPWTTLLVQTEDPLLSDPRMRRAIAHALDLEQIAAAANFGHVGANPSAVPVGSRFYSDAQKVWPAYDPAKAAALLREAGYSGQPIKIQTNKKYQGMFDNSVIIQAMLSAAGINAQLDVMDWATQLDNYLKGDFQLSSFGYSARLDPALMYATFVGDKEKGGWFQWDDPEAIEWVNQLSLIGDDAQRQALLDKLHAKMADQIPIYGLYNDALADAVSPKVGGYKIWAADKPRFWGVWKAE